MASVKIFSLAVKTLAKPIANTIKAQATQHESFRNICIGLAQRMHRTEARMRMGLLNEEAKNIKPLNDTRAVQNGATTLAETFLFLVGAGLVLGESYRSARKEGRRRDEVADRLDALEAELRDVRARVLVQTAQEWAGQVGGEADGGRRVGTAGGDGPKEGGIASGREGEAVRILDEGLGAQVKVEPAGRSAERAGQ
ncbi:hypothetical protein Q5752_000380 [Cryptotrichosporon argae]